jgi:hypothetical protein
MKFFTDKKYEQNNAHSEYETYCRAIWASLPDDLKRIQEGMLPEDLLIGLNCIGLHDATIIKFDEFDQGIIIEFNTDNNGDLRKVWIIQLFSSFLKSAPFAQYLKLLRFRLKENGVKTKVFNSIPYHQWFMCMWTSGKRKKLQQCAGQYDALIVLGWDGENCAKII